MGHIIYSIFFSQKWNFANQKRVQTSFSCKNLIQTNNLMTILQVAFQFYQLQILSLGILWRLEVHQSCCILHLCLKLRLSTFSVKLPFLPTLAVGDKIPADMRMVEMLSSHVRVDQAILTGTYFTFLLGTNFTLMSRLINYLLKNNLQC